MPSFNPDWPLLLESLCLPFHVVEYSSPRTSLDINLTVYLYYAVYSFLQLHLPLFCLVWHALTLQRFIVDSNYLSSSNLGPALVLSETSALSIVSLDLAQDIGNIAGISIVLERYREKRYLSFIVFMCVVELKNCWFCSHVFQDWFRVSGLGGRVFISKAFV